VKISSIFETLDGEVTDRGPLQWSVFVRTGGCHIRCWKSSGYCDAPHTLDLKHPYKEKTVPEIVAHVVKTGIRRVTITGGEPLLQKTDVFALAAILRGRGIRVTLETSGTLLLMGDTNQFDCVVMDIKVPSSEMSHKNEYANFKFLRRQDYLKAVVSDFQDLEWLEKKLWQIPTSASIAVGPRVRSGVTHIELAMDYGFIAEWMRKKELWDWRLNIQLHKIIWPDAVRPEQETLIGMDYKAYEEGEV